MIEYDRSQPLIFIHVPKTAGTSVRDVFRTWFKGGFYNHYFKPGNPEGRVRADYQRLAAMDAPTVIYGHFNRKRNLGIQQVYPAATQFITILREPFDRRVSGYFFQKRRPKPQFPPEHFEIETMVRNPDQTFLNHFPRPVTRDNFREICEKYFIDIGVVERLPASLDRIASRLGFGFNPDFLPVKNASERNERIPEYLRSLDREVHELEYLIYDYVLERVSAADA